MNWEIIGVFAEIVGAIGVVVSLVYLAWWEQEVQAPVFRPEFVSIIADAPVSGFKVKFAGLES